jgi:hypothetical protein
VEDAAATPHNNSSAVFCSLASVDPAFLFHSLAGLGDEGGSGSSRDLGGFGDSWSLALLVRERGAGGPLVASSSPTSPLPVGLGGEGIGERVNKLTGSSEFFPKRGRHCLCCTAATLVNLVGLGGDEVALGLLRSAWACDGPLWEPLEFRLSPSAAALSGHRDSRP